MLLTPKKTILKRRLLSKRPLPLLYPETIDLQYQSAVSELIREWEAVIRGQDTRLIQNQYRFLVTGDSWEDDFARYIKIIEEAVSVSAKKFTDTIKGTAEKVLSWNKKQWEKHTKSVLGEGIVLDRSNKLEIAKRFLKKEEEKVSSLATRIVDTTKSTLLESLPKDKEFTLDTLKIEQSGRLNASLGVSQFNAELYRETQLSSGIDEYIWRTRRDEKVRGTHRPLEGKICSWKDVTIFKYTQNSEWQSRRSIGAVELNPGEDYNCRCYPSANFVKLLEE